MLEIMKASAGSGKTYSLTEKYISLILESKDRYAYRHILAVTFTNKATEEMKSRILKELHLLATEPEKSGYCRRFVPSMFPSANDLRTKAEVVLHDILHDYSAFAVSTIDKFFQQTLKAFSREIGQFASYQVELDKDALVEESVDRILDSLTEDDRTLLSWLTENVLEQIEQGGRYSMDANLLDMAKRLKSSQRKEVIEEHRMDEDEICSKEKLIRIREKCREVIMTFNAKVRSKAREAVAILTEAGVRTEDSNRGFMNCLHLYAEMGDKDIVTFPSDSFMSKAPDKDLWFPKAKAKKLLPLVYPFLEAPLEDFHALFGQEYVVYNTACILDGQLYGLGVTRELNRTFKELMKEKNVLCIDDSNTILRDIIDGSDAPFIYEKTGVRFEHFLLDEFQDTAKVQWLNMSPLIHNSDSQGGKNLIVGDVKQSIYRWRGSDWKLFDETVPSEFERHKERVLDTNYRSLANVVEFNNLFFTAAAKVIDKMDGYEDGGPLCGIYADVCQKVAKSDMAPGSVSLTFCPKEQELQKVLDSVMEARESGAMLSDIAVLVRSNAVGEEVASFLMDNGVTVITDDSLKVKGSMTVRKLVSLMSYVENPDDTVSGFLARSLDICPKTCYTSLVDMAEDLLRGIKVNDEEGLWRGEILHVQSFMDHLQDYVTSDGNSLRGFLKWWEGEDPSISSPSSGDSVRVMTIHKSKGLDFPYVIIPFAEGITLNRPDNSWCVPDLEGTVLEGIAEGVYDVKLSSDSARSLFAKDYERQNFLQHVDNMNILYVAMTRPALGMHIISRPLPSTVLKAIDAGDLGRFKDFSQILYWYASSSVLPGDVVCVREDDVERFDLGKMVDFAAFRKADTSGIISFDVSEGDEYPSFPLNPGVEDAGADVRERGRLKFSADSLDFFSADGDAGMDASNRMKGIVLHDILSRIKVPSDLDAAVGEALMKGEITVSEAESVKKLLSERLSQGVALGWFPDDPIGVYNETDVIDSDGRVFRPDRVVIVGGKVSVIDYKSGESRSAYGRQVSVYADMWRRMGYEDVSAYIWYIHTGEIESY